MALLKNIKELEARRGTIKANLEELRLTMGSVNNLIAEDPSDRNLETLYENMACYANNLRLLTKAYRLNKK